MKLAKVMNRIGSFCLLAMWIPFVIVMITNPALHLRELTSERNPSAIMEKTMTAVQGTTTIVFLATGIAVAGIGLKVGALIVKGLENKAILLKGEPATAKIIQISDTGTTINDNPVVRLQLEVYPPNQPSFRAEAQQMISRIQIPMVQPGNMVYVRYDPNSHVVALASRGNIIPESQEGTTTSDDQRVAQIYDLESASDGKPIVSNNDWSETDKALVEREGKNCFITLRSIKETDRSQNSMPLVQLSYDVFVSHEEPYMVTKEVPMPTIYFQQLQKTIGKNFSARVHPHDREKLLIDFIF